MYVCGVCVCVCVYMRAYMRLLTCSLHLLFSVPTAFSTSVTMVTVPSPSSTTVAVVNGMTLPIVIV